MNTEEIMSVLHGVIVALALIAIAAKGYHETLIQHLGLFMIALPGLGMVFAGHTVTPWVEVAYTAGIAVYGVGTGLKHWLKYEAARRAQIAEQEQRAHFSRVQNWLHQVAGDVDGLSLHQDTVVIDADTARRLRGEPCARSPHSSP